MDGLSTAFLVCIVIGAFALLVLFIVSLNWLQRRHRHRILGILYNAKGPLRDADIISRGNGALDHKQIHGTLHLLRVEGLITEFQIHDDFRDGVPVTRYGITRYGKAYVEDCLPAPVA